MDEATIPLVVQHTSNHLTSNINVLSSKRLQSNSLDDDSNYNNINRIDEHRSDSISKVDMDAHVGLRGVAAVWIMLFHCSFYSTLGIDLQGSSIMPLFFLLSGFSLTVTYCKHPRIDSSSNTIIPQFNENSFFWNRLSRVIPVYYLGLCISLPLNFAGYSSQSPSDYIGIILSAIVSFIPVNTLLCFLLGGALDGPGWTISTLVFMWLWFPSRLNYLCTLTDEELVAKISTYYWIQLILVFVLFFGLVSVVEFWVAFCAATMNPLSRMPVFMMGMCGGILCLRHPMNMIRNSNNRSRDHSSVEEGANTSTPTSTATTSYIEMPWNKAYLTYFPSSQIRLSSTTSNADTQSHPTVSHLSSHLIRTQSAQYELVTLQSDHSEESHHTSNPVNSQHNYVQSDSSYSHNTNTQINVTTNTQHIDQAEAEIYRKSSISLSIFLLSRTLLFSIIDYVNQIFSGGSILGFVWFQAILPFVQLSLIVSLCRENGTSLVYKFLTRHISVWLGERSMCIYLLHWPLIYYVCWAVHGSTLDWPTVFDCTSIADNTLQAGCYLKLYQWNTARIMPLWGIPVVVVLTLLLSDCVYRYVEVPMRCYLKRTT